VDAAIAWDPAAVDRLCRLGGNSFAAKMLGLFLSYGGVKVAEAEAARQSGNLAGLAAAAHALKSSAGNVGALRVQQLAAQAEESANAARAGEAAAAAAACACAFVELRPRIEAELARLQTKALQDSSGGLG